MSKFTYPTQLNFYGLLLFMVRPAMLAFYVWGILLLFVPNYFRKYTAEIVDKELRANFDKTYYFDLDGDKLSERISAGYNGFNEDVIRIQYFNKNAEPYNQWQLPGKWLQLFKLTFGDYNHNGFSEVYSLNLVGDSIFLNIKEVMLAGGLDVKNRFVCKAGTFNNNQIDVMDWGGRLMDINKDGLEEYIFFLHGGYSKFPRNTFAYDIVTDSLSVSPPSASGFALRTYFMDINGDGVSEITGGVGSPENIHYEVPFTDSCTWLMVIDPTTMNFSFPPVRYDAGIASTINPVFFRETAEKKYIAATVNFRSARKSKGTIDLLLFDINGKHLKSNEIEMGLFKTLTLFTPATDGETGLFLIDNFGHIYKTDTTLELKQHYFAKNSITTILSNFYSTIDADGDGEKEMIFMGNDKENTKLLIYSSDLKSCTELPLTDNNLVYESHVELIEDGAKAPDLLNVQVDNYLYTIRYKKSGLYIFKYPFYFGLYFLLFVFFWLLQKAQNTLAQRKLEAEKQLMKQQLTISKNQLEPHFMLNTLNNIGYMFISENREDAQYYFGKFASLIQRGLKYADQVETSLQEELEFIRDYLILQKKRFNGDLEFSIEVNEEIKLTDLKIPHSLLYTFVENAIKHGLAPKNDNRRLTIIVSNEEKNTLVIISDNGIGRAQSNELKTSGTGKGLHIIKNHY